MIAAVIAAAPANGFVARYSFGLALLLSIALVVLLTGRELLLQAQPLVRGRTAVRSRRVLMRARRLRRRRRLLDACVLPLLVGFATLVVARFVALA